MSNYRDIAKAIEEMVEAVARWQRAETCQIQSQYMLGKRMTTQTQDDECRQREVQALAELWTAREALEALFQTEQVG